MDEIFVDITDYPDYKISNFGNVYSKKLKRIISSPIDVEGYCRIGLWKNSQVKKYFVHRLVALHFIPNPENKPRVNHNDGNRQNNHINNLCWMTVAEQNQHAVDVLGKKFTGRTKKFYTFLKNNEELTVSSRDAHKLLKCCNKQFKRLINGERNEINGYYVKKNIINE